MAIQYRQLQAPAQLETSMPDTGAASAAENLARTFKSFSDTAANLGGVVQTSRGAAAGAAAGVSDNPTPVRGFGGLTVYGRAYNNAAEATYVSKTHIDAANTIDQIEQDNAGDLPTYRAKVTGYIDGLRKSTPAEFWPQVAAVVQGRAEAGAVRVHGQELQAQREDAQNSYLKGAAANIQLALKSLDGPGADQVLAQSVVDNNDKIDALIKGRVITAEQGAAYRDSFQAQLHNALEQEKVNGPVEGLMAIARSNVEEGDAALARMMADPNMDSKLKVDIERKYADQRHLLEFERARTHTPESNALAQELAAGGYGAAVEDQARTLYRAGATSPDEFRSQMAASTRNQLTAADTNANVAAVQNAIATNTGLDPKNAGQVKAVDDYFKAAVAQAGETPGSERWINAAATLIGHLNVLPPSAESWVRIGLMSGDPAQASVAAAAYKRFHDANPAAAMFESDPKIHALAETLNANLSAGMPPSSAYTLATTTVNAPPALKEVYDQNYRKGEFVKTNGDWLRNNVLGKSTQMRGGGLFSNTPTVPPQLQADFERAAQQYYQMTGGDIDSARKLAGEAVVRGGLWGVSEVNGKREIMKYAPEATSGLRTADVRTAIAEFVKGVAVPSPDGHGTTMPLDPQTVSLIASPDTDRTHGQVWNLGIHDEYGAPDVLRGPTGRPAVFTLPNPAAAFQATQAAAKAKALADAVQARERQQALEPVRQTVAELHGGRF